MKILAFAASNSKNSINKQLVSYAVGLIDFAEIEILDIHDYELPIYSPEREAEFDRLGKKPDAAESFYAAIGAADALLISFAEHNGSYTAAYKNLFDWTSRIESKVYQEKPIVMLATSPGPGGAKNVLSAASSSAPYFGGNLKGTLSVSSFNDAFDNEKQQFKDGAIVSELRLIINHLRVG